MGNPYIKNQQILNDVNKESDFMTIIERKKSMFRLNAKRPI